MSWGFRFDFDGGYDDDDDDSVADEPHIYITDPDGADRLEVLEDAVPTVKRPDMDETHWRLPDASLTMRLLTFLNASA
mgnify:CR=1 FL=1